METNVQSFAEMAKALAQSYGMAAIAAIVTMAMGWVIAQGVRAGLRRSFRLGKIDVTIARFVTNLVYVALLTFFAIAALGRLGVQTGSFIAVIGAAGLAVGFALQSSLGNFAAGVMIILFKPFRAGDYIEAAGVAGTVDAIQIFATSMKTPDNKEVIVPNGSLIASPITNFTRRGTRRVDMVFGIGYADDLRAAKQILADLAAGDDRVLEDPAPFVGVVELAESSVNIAVRPWVKTSDYGGVKSDYLEAAKGALEAEGISLPYPHRELYVHNVAS